MPINIIVAKCRNNGIGYNNNLPWKLKNDMKSGGSNIRNAPHYEKLLKNSFSVRYIIIFEIDENRSYYAPFRDQEAASKLLFKRQND